MTALLVLGCNVGPYTAVNQRMRARRWFWHLYQQVRVGPVKLDN